MAEKSSPSLNERLVFRSITLAFIAVWIGTVALEAVRHQWIVDNRGRPLPTDFLEVWVAGKFALQGAVAAPYDWKLHHAAQIAVMGHPFSGYLGWLYPPIFLLVAAVLALLPYSWAFVLWVAGTCALYAPVIGRIARTGWAAILALASPAALGTVLAGQNGFLSGALIGATLLFLETRPLVAGLFLGLLTYKPQLGLLFPFVLLVGRQWKCLASASVTAALCILIPYLLFGAAPFAALLHFLPQTNSTVLASGRAGWNKLQTVYGLVKSIGGSNVLAWQLQAASAFAAACAIAWLWRTRHASFALKAAALSAGILAATPYLYLYDLPILAVSLAFLFRDRAFDRLEWIGIASVALALLSYLVVMLPVGPLLLLIIAAMIVRRVHESELAPPWAPKSGTDEIYPLPLDTRDLKLPLQQ
ncbi:MAG TPA: glycosyltransferase family 87 protein [Rhizomicrobium sp.]|nr:glycosyltransferase family 87 protein [Rhizomicrobium sp.]